MSIVLTICPLTSEAARIEDRYAEGAFVYTIDTEFFRTKANYDADGGGFDSLPNNNSFYILKWKNRIGYNLVNNWTLFTGLDFAYSQSSDVTANRSNSAPSDIALGIQGRFLFKKLSLNPLLQVTYPLQRVTDTLDDSLITEGAVEYEGGLGVKYRFSKLYLSALGSYIGRDEGRSSQLKAKLDIEYKMKRLYLGVGLTSFSTITNDEQTNTPSVRDTVTQRVNGSSKYFYGVNPELLSGSAWGRYKFSRSSMALVGVTGTIDGKNSAQGLGVFAQVEFTFITARPTRRTPKHRKDKEDLENFESESQGYDESLFKDDNKSNDSP